MTGHSAERVAAARVGHLATVRPDGSPHVVVCCFVLDGETVYTAVDAKPKTTTALQRIANLEAHPAATLLVDHYDDEDWSALWWVRVDGQGRIVPPWVPERDHALDLLAAKYPRYRDQRPAGPVIALDIMAWRSWP